MKILYCLLIGLFPVSLVHGQSNFYASANFKDSTVVTTVPVVVKAGTRKINCLFNGALSAGTLSIMFRDPEGRNAAGFSLDASDGEKSSGAKGGARQEFNSPYAGTWELYIKLEHASGGVTYQIVIRP